MAAEGEGEDETFWEPTAQMFSQLFKRPPMTKKLLSRPPFKFILDVVVATIKATEFAQDVFSEEELSQDLYKARDPKLAFLTKLVDLVEQCVGDKIDVKPSKIIAGMEPEKTNSFLQIFCHAAINRLDKGEGEEDEEDIPPPPPPPPPQFEDIKEAPKKPKRPKDKEPKGQRHGTQNEDLGEVGHGRRPVSPKQEAKRDREEEELRIKKEKKKRKQEEDDDFIQKEFERPKMDMRDIDEGKSAFVKETKKQMQEVEVENVQEPAEKKGSGIRIKKRLGKKESGTKGRGSKGGDKLATKIESREDITGEKEVEFMRQAIQALTKCTNPLGKSIDFVAEDIDSMIKEFEGWRKQYHKAQIQLEEQIKKTEDEMQPFQDKLAEVDEMINEQNAKIDNARTKIIKNEETIQNLLYSVVAAK